MTDGDKILAAALVTMITVIAAVLKQSQLFGMILDKLGDALALRIAKQSKWECKYPKQQGESDGPQKPGGKDQSSL